MKIPRSNILDQKILNFISSREMICESDSILIALSGGPDSVFALHFFHKYKRKFGIQLAAVHVNHSIRGKEADQDEKFARELCGKLGIHFYSKKVNVPAYSRKNKISIEEAARILRYGAIEKIAAEFKYNKIVTAHNLDDNAETVFMNLLSGTGISGLSGIPVSRGPIIRPLLPVAKREILNYLGKNRIEFRIDSSNLENDYRRNFIRNRIFPLIKENLNPSFEDAILRTSMNLSGSLNFLESAVEAGIAKFVKGRKNSVEINVDLFGSEYGGIAGEILRRIMKNKFSHDFISEDFRKIHSLVSKQKGRKFIFPGGISAVREEHSIAIQLPDKKITDSESAVKSGDALAFGSKKMKILKIPASKIKFAPGGKVEFLDADKLDDIFIFRRWKSGDKFIPLGMSGFKKVSDFLNDCKINAAEKKNQFVLLNRNQIVWIVGLRIDNRYKITKETKRAYKLWII